jgi:hypothetical protein
MKVYILARDVKCAIGQNDPSILRIPLSSDIPVKSNLNFLQLYCNKISAKAS